MVKKKEESKSAIEWEKRTLCSDPACIGVIGPDGCCKECGRPYGGDPFEDSPLDESVSEPEFAETEPVAEAVESESVELAEEDEAPSTDTAIEWEKRTLCSDPACIGVIGPDGRCKECGRPYQGE